MMKPKTGRCRCHKPEWRVSEAWQRPLYLLGYTLCCANCSAVWKSVSRDNRRYADLEAPIYPGSDMTFKALFSQMDKRRREYLEGFVHSGEEKIAGIQKGLLYARQEMHLLDKDL